ncbi:competence protein ComK [Desemzia sp. RIT804]|uniref:competence protein ComK n=1 Tax=Desemzia sp. RIT 804 TaxID=2810209 RepID=UPI00194FD9A8|nr:competence protein ComK [Desemzia sp. RIT 804]MBM6615351.1 competence protein ComK [Desemzia sp. RIT 804]
MREDFERNQHREYFTGLSTNYYQSTDSHKHPAHYINETPNLKYYYQTTLTKQTTESLLIAEQNLSTLLTISREQKHIVLTSKTFYIKDICDRKDTPFNTLVFQFDEPPLKTTEDSRTIMERYFNQKPFPYSFIQYVGKSLGFHKRCPFVSGHEIFIPEKGTTTGSTSWYAAHHILLATENKADNHMQITFRHHYELQLDISPHSFKEQIERSAVLSHMQRVFITELIGLYPHTHLSQYRDELNIVERRLKDPAFTTVHYPLDKVMVFMSYFRINEILEKIFGEKNPYIDEIRSHFMKNFKSDSPSK